MKPFTAIAAVLFAVIALLHLVRLFQGWVVVVNGLTMPLWISWAALAVSGLLAVMLWREAQG